MPSELVGLLANPGGCTKPICSTCGGLMAFGRRVLDYASQAERPLADLLAEVSPHDLEQLPGEWQACLEHTLTLTPMAETVLPAWRQALVACPRVAMCCSSAFFRDGLADPALDMAWIRPAVTLALRMGDGPHASALLTCIGPQSDGFPNLVAFVEAHQNVLANLAEGRAHRKAERHERELNDLETAIAVKAAKATCDIFPAIRRGDQIAVAALVRRGADLSATNAEGQTPLEAALSSGRTDLSDFLQSSSAESRAQEGP